MAVALRTENGILAWVIIKSGRSLQAFVNSGEGSVVDCRGPAAAQRLSGLNTPKSRIHLRSFLSAHPPALHLLLFRQRGGREREETLLLFFATYDTWETLFLPICGDEIVE